MSYEDGMPAGGNSRFRGYPARMSERQQLALLLQMTSQDNNATQGITQFVFVYLFIFCPQRTSYGPELSRNIT